MFVQELHRALVQLALSLSLKLQEVKILEDFQVTHLGTAQTFSQQHHKATWLKVTIIV